MEGATLFTMNALLAIFEMTDNRKRMLLLTLITFASLC